MPTLAPPVGFVGYYDPATFVSGVVATFPQLPAGQPYYQPGMAWQSTGTGDVDGQNVKPGDYLFVVPTSRPWGLANYGDMIFGGTGPNNWSPEAVRFQLWDASLPPSLWPPFPYSGCPFTRADLPDGDWAPGWRIVIDAMFVDLTTTREYGSTNYGGGVYGDVGGGTVSWVDVTRPSYSVRAVSGTSDGTDIVDVDTVEILMADEDGSVVDFPDPAYWYSPFIGDPIRVGLFDPLINYYPLIVGEIELIGDDHDGEHPRSITIQAFGHVMDLVVDLFGWQRPAELASTRVEALKSAARWRYGMGNLFYPGDAQLAADAAPRDVSARDEIDRSCRSIGWMLDTDRWGSLRIRQWPLEPTRVIDVTDCDEPAAPVGSTVSHLLSFVADQDELLNRATMTSDTQTIADEDTLSVDRFGPRGRALGFPKTGLAFANGADAQAVVDRAVARYARVVRRLAKFDADTRVDPRWLPVLAQIDSGVGVHVTRVGLPAVYELDAVVVGYDHTITPGRIASTITTTTLTQTN